MSGCSVYTVSGNTGVYVKSFNKTLPFYQTTVIEGNATTDYRHFAEVQLIDDRGKVKKTKADIKGNYELKVKNIGVYTIKAQFNDELFVEKEFTISEEENSETIIDLIVE
jgi:hypothetical protein